MSKQAFVDALALDPYDQTTHLVYADWLEENGLDDEAAHQRAWTPERQHAIEWLEGYAKEVQMSYEDLITAAEEYLDTGDLYCLPFDTPDIVFEERESLWNKYELATGNKVHDEYRGDRIFRCAC